MSSLKTTPAHFHGVIPHDTTSHDTLPPEYYHGTLPHEDFNNTLPHEQPSGIAVEMAEMADLNECCRLLALPAELREQIWILAVEPGDATYHQREPAIMCVSRGVRAKTLSIYYSRYTLLIESHLWHHCKLGQSPLPPYTFRVSRDHEGIEPRKLERVTRFKLRYRLSLSNIPGYIYLDYDIVLNNYDDGYTFRCSLGAQSFHVMTENQTTYTTEVETALRSLLSAKLAALMAGGHIARGRMDAATLTALTRIRKGCLPPLEVF